MTNYLSSNLVRLPNRAFTAKILWLGRLQHGEGRRQERKTSCICIVTSSSTCSGASCLSHRRQDRRHYPNTWMSPGEEGIHPCTLQVGNGDIVRKERGEHRKSLLVSNKQTLNNKPTHFDHPHYPFLCLISPAIFSPSSSLMITWCDIQTKCDLWTMIKTNHQINIKWERKTSFCPDLCDDFLMSLYSLLLQTSPCGHPIHWYIQPQPLVVITHTPIL
jgi:hypothetical protein